MSLLGSLFGRRPALRHLTKPEPRLSRVPSTPDPQSDTAALDDTAADDLEPTRAIQPVIAAAVPPPAEADVLLSTVGPIPEGHVPEPGPMLRNLDSTSKIPLAEAAVTPPALAILQSAAFPVTAIIAPQIAPAMTTAPVLSAAWVSMPVVLPEQTRDLAGPLRTIPPEPSLTFGAKPITPIRTILADIETLGASPEFGLLREKLGAGPDGLFGFGTMYPSALTVLLQTRFAGIGAVENLAARPAWGYYYVVDKRYDLSWKSDIEVGEMDEARLLAFEAARLARLRSQLITHLMDNARLFVYAGAASPEEIAKIRTAMALYGRSTLLHVAVATDAHPAGHVLPGESGLLHGFLSRYGNSNGRWDIAIDDWTAICRTAHGIWTAQ